MTWTPYTGKGLVAVFNPGSPVTLPGIRTTTIEENGQPLPTPLDKTKAGDSAYAFMDDPLGGKGSVNGKVTFEGLLSVTSHQDTDWLTLTEGASGTLTITTVASGDEYTMSNAVLKSLDIKTPVAGLSAFTAVFSNATSAGAWATDVP